MERNSKRLRCLRDLVEKTICIDDIPNSVKICFPILMLDLKQTLLAGTMRSMILALAKRKESC